MHVQAQERAAYLANVLAIAKSDGVVGDDESDILKDITRRIGASWSDLERARELIGDGTYTLKLMRDPGTRASNLEDMITIAMGDGRITGEESKPIESVAKVMGYAQVDVEMAVKRARNRVRKIQDGTSHAKAIPFDSELAVTVESEEEHAVESEVKPSQPSLEPDSKGYVDPSSLYQEAPSPEFEPPPSAVYHPPKPDLVESEVEMPTADVASDEAVQNVEESSAVATPDEVSSEDDTYSPLERCIRAHDEAADPHAYCFGAGDCINVWGCRLAQMDWKSGADWFTQGWFRDDSTFVFDREGIEEQLLQNLQRADGCPYLKGGYSHEAVQALPSRASVAVGRWDYRRSDDRYEERFLVETRAELQGCTISSTATVSGVDPQGDAEARRIIRDACRSAGVERPEL